MTTIFHRFYQYQDKWRKSLVYFNWVVVFLGTIIGLLPIFLHCDEQRRGYPTGYFQGLLNNSTVTAPIDSSTFLSLWTDDYVGFLGTPDVKGAEIVGPFLGMCLPALFDLLVELYVTVTTRSTTTLSSNQNNDFQITRLSKLERFVFIIGVMCNAFYFLIPSDWNVMVIFMVRIETTILSNILINAPIITFLERSTNVFSPFFTSFVLVLLVLGNLLGMYAYELAHDTLSERAINSSGFIINIICSVFILSSCLWSSLHFLYLQYTQTAVTEINKEQHDPFLDFSKTHVPACHMVALCMNVAITMGFNFGTPSPSVYNLLYTLLLLAAALVFTIEMRVRQNEIVIGLNQLDVRHFEAKVAEAEAASLAYIAEQEKAAKKREMQLNLELKENIANSAHDMKSPACALSLAVDSLISAFDGNTHIDKDGCKMTMETLKGMMHTLSSLNILINRSVDAASKTTGHSLVPNMESIEIRKLLGDIMGFMSWQAENSSLAATLESVPDNLPTNIWADLKWLREDLLCVAANALKFSRERSKVPVIVRVTIDAIDDNSMLCFTFLDSGRNLSEDQHSKLFNYPRMRSSDRMGMGGMGLGLYCLRERVTAMRGQCGSRARRDGLEGTEIWFCIPLIDAGTKINSFKFSRDISPKSHSISHGQQDLPMIKENVDAAVDNIAISVKPSNSVMVIGGGSCRLSSKSTNFITALGGSRRSSKSNVDVLDRSTGRKSSSTPPLLSLTNYFDRISEEKGGVTLPILLVDDSIAILKMIKRSLLNEMPDLIIKEARDGLEAFDRVQEESNGFHIIITDIQMPNCDGLDFTTRVREYEDRNRLSPTMVIGMSANYQEKIISECVRCGMDGFLHKPFELQSLMDVINHVQLHRDLTKEFETKEVFDDMVQQRNQTTKPDIETNSTNNTLPEYKVIQEPLVIVPSGSKIHPEG